MSDNVLIMFCLIGVHSLIWYILLIFRGNLLKALREKYSHDTMDNAEDFDGWKPDDVHEVEAKTWESVDISCFCQYW